jgi:hypothetical protein
MMMSSNVSILNKRQKISSMSIAALKDHKFDKKKTCVGRDYAHFSRILRIIQRPIGRLGIRYNHDFYITTLISMIYP